MSRFWSTPRALVRMAMVVSALTQLGWLARAVALDSGYQWAEHLAAWSFARLMALSLASGSVMFVMLMRWSTGERMAHWGDCPADRGYRCERCEP